MELSRSLLSGWVDACCRLLSPLEGALQGYVLTDGKLHADDTPVPVLLPGNKKTKTGRLWTYVRDDRNAGSALAPTVWFAYSPDRKGPHPQTHLAGFSDVLQAASVTPVGSFGNRIDLCVDDRFPAQAPGQTDIDPGQGAPRSFTAAWDTGKQVQHKSPPMDE